MGKIYAAMMIMEYYRQSKAKKLQAMREEQVLPLLGVPGWTGCGCRVCLSLLEQEVWRGWVTAGTHTPADFQSPTGAGPQPMAVTVAGPGLDACPQVACVPAGEMLTASVTRTVFTVANGATGERAC